MIKVNPDRSRLEWAALDPEMVASSEEDIGFSAFGVLVGKVVSFTRVAPADF